MQRSAIVVVVLLACGESGMRSAHRDRDASGEGNARATEDDAGRSPRGAGARGSDGDFAGDAGAEGDGSADASSASSCSDEPAGAACDGTPEHSRDCYPLAVGPAIFAGDSIAGSLRVRVLDEVSGAPIPGAFVLVGDDPMGPLHGVTDASGEVAISGDMLSGAVSVHVAGPCIVTTTIAAVGRSELNVAATPRQIPTCGMAVAGEPPEGVAGAIVSGALILPERGWDALPMPRSDESRVAYVYTTRARVRDSLPRPDLGGTHPRVTADDPDGSTRYSIFARPGDLAVYAVAGIERTSTAEFIPYVMGVARAVSARSGTETSGVDITLDIPLDRKLSVELEDLPAATPAGLDRVTVQANLDLGGDGLIVRRFENRSFDSITSSTLGTSFDFLAQPAPSGALCGARYELLAGLYGGDTEISAPYSEQRVRDVAQGPDPVRIGGFLDVARAPARQSTIITPADRVLRWTMNGPAPDLVLVELYDDAGLVWQQILPGTRTEAAIPELAAPSGGDSIAGKQIRWLVRAIALDGADYDQLKYTALATRYWIKTSLAEFQAQL